MASSYRGLYVIYTNGQPTDVQVQDTGGNRLPYHWLTTWPVRLSRTCVSCRAKMTIECHQQGS